MAQSATHTDERHTVPEHAAAKDTKAEPQRSPDQVAALKLATGKSDPLAPAPRTSLAHSTITYEAHCGKILGIGHPIGGGDLYELTLAADPAGGEDETVTVLAPRGLEHYQHFSVGSYYCVPLSEAGEEITPVAILPAAFFTKATATPPVEPPLRRAAHDKDKEESHGHQNSIKK